jgi:hypothetical protein
VKATGRGAIIDRLPNMPTKKQGPLTPMTIMMTIIITLCLNLRRDPHSFVHLKKVINIMMKKVRIKRTKETVSNRKLILRAILCQLDKTS